MIIPNIPSSTAPRRQLAKARASVDVNIHDEFVKQYDINRDAVARARLKHSVETILPSNYTPHGIVPKDDEMRVAGVQAKKVQNIRPSVSR